MTEEKLEKGRELLVKLKKITILEKRINSFDSWFGVNVISQLETIGLNSYLDREAKNTIASLVREQIAKRRAEIQTEFANL